MNSNRPTFYNRSSSADPLFQSAYKNGPNSDVSHGPSAAVLLSSCRREAFSQQLSHPSLYHVLQQDPVQDFLAFLDCKVDTNDNDEEDAEEEAKSVTAAAAETLRSDECIDCIKADASGSMEKGAAAVLENGETIGAVQFISVLALLEIVRQLTVASNGRADHNMVILDTRENRVYQTSHVKHALSASCHTKPMAKRSIACWRSMNARDLGGKRVFLYDLKTAQGQQQQGKISGHLEMLVDFLLRQGNQVFLLDGGWTRFKELGGNEEEFLESCMEKELVTRYAFSPTNADNGSEDVLNATASEVLDYLWLGNERDAHDLDLLRRNGITHVLNVTNDVINFFETEEPSLTYLRLPASDSHSQDLLKFFDEAFTFIENARKQKGRVFVHCWAGVSRSATIVASYLMRAHSCPVAEALDFVRLKRGIVAPNINFMGQLERFFKSFKADNPPHGENGNALPCCLDRRLIQESDDSGLGSEKSSKDSSIKSVRSSDDVSDCDMEDVCCEEIRDGGVLLSASFPSASSGAAEKHPLPLKLTSFTGMRLGQPANNSTPSSSSAPPAEMSTGRETCVATHHGRFSFR